MCLPTFNNTPKDIPKAVRAQLTLPITCRYQMVKTKWNVINRIHAVWKTQHRFAYSRTPWHDGQSLTALQLPRHINEMTLPLNNPDFAKVVLTKNNVCVFTLQKSLFCVAKQALLLCKTMVFGTYCNGAYNAISNSLRKRTSFSENKRRSLTLYFRLVMRSTPIPKA